MFILSGAILSLMALRDVWEIRLSLSFLCYSFFSEVLHFRSSFLLQHWQGQSYRKALQAVPGMGIASHKFLSNLMFGSETNYPYGC